MQKARTLSKKEGGSVNWEAAQQPDHPQKVCRTEGRGKGIIAKRNARLRGKKSPVERAPEVKSAMIIQERK